MTLQPKIVISVNDYKRLGALLDRLPYNETVEQLVNELERADIVENHLLPENTVAMHSTVTFTVLSTTTTYTYRLVYPDEVSLDGTLSVLSPVGSALLGLSVHQIIDWPLNNTKFTTVRIDATSPPNAAIPTAKMRQIL